MKPIHDDPVLDRSPERRIAARRLMLSPEGLEHIKDYEGFRAAAYDDLAPSRVLRDPDDVEGTLTIGYGHTGAFAEIGETITEAQATEILLRDIEPRESAVRRLVKAPLTQGEYDALVGFLYNVGEANFRRSTLLKRLNAGDHDGAAAEFARWVYSKGRRLKGLEIRREAERAMFLGLPQVALLDLGAMAGRAEAMLEIGANVRPDAIEERGVTKPLVRSKTVWAGISTIAAAVLPSLAGLDQRVQMVAVLLLGGYLVLNRVLEHRAGEH